MNFLTFNDNPQAARLCVCQVVSTHPYIITDAFDSEYVGVVDDFGNLIGVQ